MRNEENNVSDIDRDIEKMTGGNNYDGPKVTMVNTDPESLMNKYKAQQSVQNELAAKELEKLSEEVNSQKQPEKIIPSNPSIDRMTNINNQSNVRNYEELPKEATVNREVPTSRIGLKEQIEMLESQLSSADNVNLNPNSSLSARSFLDDFGDETFFVQNTSNGHVMITDLDLKIPRGKVLNLLKYNHIDEIKSSRDIKIALSANPRSNPLLRRLTPEEYITRLTEEVNNEKKIDHYRKVSQLRAQTGEAESVNKQETTRPIILDKINKLKLGYSDQFHKGITPVEFAQWVNIEDLTKNELDLILGHVDDQDLRILINEKKKSLIEKSYK